MPNQEQQLLRRLTIGLLGLAFAIAAFVAFNYYVLQPRFIIEAPLSSTVTIRDLSTGDIVTTQQTKSAETIIHSGTGSYVIQVASKTKQQTFYADAGVFQSYTYTLDAPQELNTSTITQAPAYNVVRQGNTIVYLDPVHRSLVSLSDTGQSTVLTQQDNTRPGSGAQGLYPVADNGAVVLAESRLWKLVGASLVPLDTTGISPNSTALVVATNQQQRSFIVAADQIVYWYESVDAVPKKVATVPNFFDELVYGGHDAIAYSTRLPQTTDNVRAAYADYAIDPILIDTSNGKTQVFASGPVVNASISPDNTYATLTPQGSHATSLYTVSDQKLVNQVENGAAGPWWFDNNSFVYAQGTAIWRYSLKDRSGVAIGTVPSKLAATSVTYDAVNKQYFATTYDNDTAVTTYSLSSSSPNHDAEQLASLANNGDVHAQFQLQYVNITKPTLVVTTRVVSANPSVAQFRAATLISRQAAVAYLRTNGIDPAVVTIIYKPSL